MVLAEKVMEYYAEKEKNCAESVLLAANDQYDLHLTEDDVVLLSGFGGGMGCGKLCGSLAGAIAVLGKCYGNREDFRDICAQFVSAFEKKLDCQSIDCTPIAARYKNEKTRCLSAVLLSAEVLESFLANM